VRVEDARPQAGVGGGVARGRAVSNQGLEDLRRVSLDPALELAHPRPTVGDLASRTIKRARRRLTTGSQQRRRVMLSTPTVSGTQSARRS
jgi:hypothetical protein